MPIFMENISEEDIEKNESCAALASIVYDEMPADEVAENRKEHGNKCLQMALNPAQEKRENLARAACYSYTEAINAKGKDQALTATIYSNRSLAQFIIGNYGHALEDAQRSIVLNPTYAKSYYRAAKCCIAVKKYTMALEFVSRVKEMADPPLDSKAEGEFEELRAFCDQKLNEAKEKQKTDLRKTKAKAVQTSNIARAITSLGVKLNPKSEVSSEQMGAYGNPKPYFDEDGLLHVPILFMYDEYSQTDIMHDVACDVLVGELVEELLPFPWDDKGRCQTVNDVVVFFKIDDGVKMPKYYAMDPSWPLLEVMRTEEYQMPGFLPVLHIVAAGSELLRDMDLTRLNH
ncbi:tetratricopeptidedomain 4 [Angomonas deanei]|nr:tetratricopeptidedomain 4 [Angomonas deanei]|eukprot:EPY34836.1 tetratricopeptidedomain 4 [Angomonas deanei]